MFSCKTIKPVISDEKELNLSKIYDSLQISEIKFKTLEIKFNVQYTGSDQNLSLKGNLKVLHDSLIWVSLSPGLGIEAARFMCNPDSLFILDRINRDLTKGTYKYLKETKRIDIDFKSLQAILLNRFFVYPSVTNERDEFINTFTIKNDSTALTVYRKSSTAIENMVNINRMNYKVMDYFISDIPNMRNLSIKYSIDNVDHDNGLSKFIKIVSNSEGKFLNIEINYTKITKDELITFPFNVPLSYKIIVY
jgi:hypothetical protein